MALIIAALLGLGGCSDPATSAADAHADTVQNADTVQSADASKDSAASDAATDTPLPYASACTPTWQQETGPIDPQQRKFALALFHFNLEYVIGGLEVTLADGSKKRFGDLPLNAGWDNAKVEDYIVDQTLRPILELFDKHPAWGVDIELQAYAIEVMAQRHPQTLALLQKLVQRGQVSLISFHYAAQFFLAFSREDQQRSLQATKQIFADYCLPLSTAVFNQEGQAGEGRQQLLVQEGYKIGVFPKNLWKYQHKSDDGNWWPLYSSEGGDLIVGPGGLDKSAGIELVWSFFDDGELRAVEKTAAGPLNPYFAPKAPTDAARVAEYEQELLSLEKAGYKLTRIADYVRRLKALGIQAKPAPPLLDGTWQAPSTHSVHKWMGNMGIPFGADEQDNAVRSGNAKAHFDVAGLQVMADQLAKGGADQPSSPQHALWLAAEQKSAALWRLLWHAEVSDCSGINPWWGEVQWGLNLNAQIAKEAKAMREQLIVASGKPMAKVDLQARSAEYGSWPTQSEPLLPIEAPLAVTLTGDRPLQAKWFAGQEPDSYLLQVIATPTDCEACSFWMAEVAFPRLEESVQYSPALIEDEVRSYPLSAFELSLGEVHLPLANGLIGLGKGWWVIKEVTSVHLAARLTAKVPSVAFEDQTAPKNGFTWRFWLFKGTAQQALQRAQRLNIAPVILYGQNTGP